jgi:PKD repeat protein
MIVILALSIVGALVPPTAGEEPPEFEWGEDIVLSESSEASDDPTVALTPDGGMVVAWRERQVGRYNVFFSILDDEGAVVGERHELGSNLSASMDPTVAVDSDGRLHFVWTALEDQELWYARADHSGDIKMGPRRLTEATGDSAEASVWMDGRDHLHIVWFDGRDAGTHLYYMQLDRNGDKVVEDTQLVQTRTEQESAVTMDSRGDLHVVWNALAPVGQIQWRTELHYTKVSSTGELLVADRVITNSRGIIGFPDVAVDLSNRVHVVFPEGVGPRESIHYARLDSSGRTEAQSMVVDNMLEGAGDVTLAVDGNDRLHMVWSQGTAGSTELRYQTFTSAGEPLGDPLQLTDAERDSRYPTIGLSPKGEPRVAWSDWRSGNAEVYLKVASLPTSGVDLAVYSRDISFDPPTVTADEPFNMTVVVHNQGATEVNMADFNVAVDGQPVYAGLIHNLRPGAVSDNTMEMLLDEGDHLITVSVDPRSVEDLAPHNNLASVSLTAHPPGQLVADAGPDQPTVVGDVTYLDASGTVYRGTGVLSYEWDFDDGSPVAFGEYVEHVYEEAGWYSVSVRVSDGVVEDTDTAIVHVEERNEPPLAVISPEGPIVADRLSDVQLSATSSSDDDGIFNLTWEMGDGTVVEGWTVSHRYTGLGIFPITLTVEDGGGLIDINKTTVEVRNLVPEITGYDWPEELEVGVQGDFCVTATDADGRVVEVGWDFDERDGITFEVKGSPAYHAFMAPGRYNVTCIVRDDDGGQEVVHMEVTVLEKESVIGDDVYWYLLVVAVLAVVVVLAMLKNRTNPDKKGPDDGTGNKEVGL